MTDTVKQLMSKALRRADDFRSVVVNNNQEVYLMAGRPSPFPGYVFIEAKPLDDGTYEAFFAREEDAERAYREMLVNAKRKNPT